MFHIGSSHSIVPVALESLVRHHTTSLPAFLNLHGRLTNPEMRFVVNLVQIDILLMKHLHKKQEFVASRIIFF